MVLDVNRLVSSKLQCAYVLVLTVLNLLLCSWI